MRLPDLLVPGAGKSATSSLHDYLGSHPEIFMSQPKEPHFFVKAERFFRVSAKVPLVTRQSSPPASLSIVPV